jgi:hypothetical protein
MGQNHGSQSWEVMPTSGCDNDWLVTCQSILNVLGFAAGLWINSQIPQMVIHIIYKIKWLMVINGD